jgi:hypothetical protein
MCRCCVVQMPDKGECCAGDGHEREITVTVKLKCEPGAGGCCSADKSAGAEPKSE